MLNSIMHVSGEDALGRNRDYARSMPYLRINEYCLVHGKANYIWDDDFKIHIPCCRVCGNGPVTGDEEENGLCSDHK
jgi:hypothetical protein